MTDGGELHPSGLGYVVDPEAKPKDAYLVDPAACITFPTAVVFDEEHFWPAVSPQMAAALEANRERTKYTWRPSPADHHDRGEDCGEVECERCSPVDS